MKYKCLLCDVEFEVPAGEEAVCPVCGATGSDLEEIEIIEKKSKYAGTKTEKNLEAAFAGESQARNKYTYFASVAKKEGYEQIASLFLKTADNEKEHAKMWFKELKGIGNTSENLAAAAESSHFRPDSAKYPKKAAIHRSYRKTGCHEPAEGAHPWLCHGAD